MCLLQAGYYDDFNFSWYVYQWVRNLLISQAEAVNRQIIMRFKLNMF